MFLIKLFVEDKNLGELLKRLTGIAMNVEHQYVPNVEKITNGSGKKNRTPPSIKGVEAMELFGKELHKRSNTAITGPEFRDMVVKLGLNRLSYSYFLQKLVDGGVLKKGKKADNVMTYHLTGK